MPIAMNFCVPERSYSKLSLDNYKSIYTDWANHYLAKSGHKRLIKDLQQDVTDGVLLAEIIQVVDTKSDLRYWRGSIFPPEGYKPVRWGYFYESGLVDHIISADKLKAEKFEHAF